MKFTTDVIVRNGIFLCMEGRRIFKDLTVEENLMAGAYTRKDRRNLKDRYGENICLFSKTESTSRSKSRISVRWRATNACDWSWDHGETEAIVTR